MAPSIVDLAIDARTYIQSLSLTESEKNLRLNHLAHFEKTGLPTSKMESWKYISWRNMPTGNYQPLAVGMNQLSKVSMEAGAFGLTSKDAVYYNPNDFYVWRFLNQEIQQSEKNALGVKLKDEPFHASNIAENSLEGLFQALTFKKILIEIPERTQVAKPILLHELFVTASVSQQHQQVEISVGPHSKAQLIYFEQSQGAGLFRQVRTKISVGKNATLDFIRIQNAGTEATVIDHVDFSLSEGAQVRNLTVALGAGTFRQDMTADLNHSSAVLETNAIVVATGSQVSDVCSLLRHQVGGSQTKQTVKSLLADQAKFNFNGMIVIAKGAKQANSEQLNKNLLLSSKAEANSKPQLQIYSDDVKATHGSTTGQLNRDEVFYFQSRAISEQRAIQMLSVGHVSELVYQIESSAIQEFVLDQVKHKLSAVRLEGL